MWCWSKNDAFSFRHNLIDIAARWKEISPSTTQRPLQFTEKELELHNSELQLHEGIGEVLHQLQNDNLIPLGGWSSENITWLPVSAMPVKGCLLTWPSPRHREFCTHKYGYTKTKTREYNISSSMCSHTLFKMITIVVANLTLN